MDGIMRRLDQAEQKINQTNHGHLENFTKQRLKLQHRENELENLKQDYIQSVKQTSEQVDKEVRKQHDLALLRATEKKLEADQKNTFYE